MIKKMNIDREYLINEVKKEAIPFIITRNDAFKMLKNDNPEIALLALYKIIHEGWTFENIESPHNIVHVELERINIQGFVYGHYESSKYIDPYGPYANMYKYDQSHVDKLIKLRKETKEIDKYISLTHELGNYLKNYPSGYKYKHTYTGRFLYSTQCLYKIHKFILLEILTYDPDFKAHPFWPDTRNDLYISDEPDRIWSLSDIYKKYGHMSKSISDMCKKVIEIIKETDNLEKYIEANTDLLILTCAYTLTGSSAYICPDFPYKLNKTQNTSPDTNIFMLLHDNKDWQIKWSYIMQYEDLLKDFINIATLLGYILYTYMNIQNGYDIYLSMQLILIYIYATNSTIAKKYLSFSKSKK